MGNFEIYFDYLALNILIYHAESSEKVGFHCVDAGKSREKRLDFPPSLPQEKRPKYEYAQPNKSK
jgi:hypothetical protein